MATAKGPPEGMTEATWRAIGKLRADVRERVLERSCIIHASGRVSWEEADHMAFEQETAR